MDAGAVVRVDVVTWREVMMKNRLIKNGVKALRDYGYPLVDERNILTDRVYAAFFLQMLFDTKDSLSNLDEPHKDIDELISQIKNNKEPLHDN